MGQESNLWEWLRGVLPLGHYSRIESGDTGPGFPDVYYRLDENSVGTIELKAARNPEAEIPFTDKRGIRKSQRIWILDELYVGGVVWIFLGIGKEILIIEGKQVRVINGATRDELYGIAEDVLSKTRPQAAAQQLESLLKKLS